MGQRRVKMLSLLAVESELVKEMNFKDLKSENEFESLVFFLQCEKQERSQSPKLKLSFAYHSRVVLLILQNLYFWLEVIGFVDKRITSHFNQVNKIFESNRQFICSDIQLDLNSYYTANTAQIGRPALPSY